MLKRDIRMPTSSHHPEGTPLRVLVVDDEPVARRLLSDLLAEMPGVELAATCRNGREALEWLGRHPVDLLLLDVQMPGLDGFGVLSGLAPDTVETPRPAVILVTAHDEFAIRAFEAEAWDYLLKPIDHERLAQAINRARHRLERLRPPPGDRLTERLAIPYGRGRVTLRLADVLWIQAESNYVRFHLRDASYLARKSLSRLEAQLDPQRFVRVHRSAIVNVEQIERLTPKGHGDLGLTLRDGQEITLSRRYRRRLDRVLQSLS